MLKPQHCLAFLSIIGAVSGCASRSFGINPDNTSKASSAKSGLLNVWYECPATTESENQIFFSLTPKVNVVINGFSGNTMLGDIESRVTNSQNTKKAPKSSDEFTCDDAVGGASTPDFKVKIAGKSYHPNKEYDVETFYYASRAYVLPDRKVYLMMTSSQPDIIEIKRLEVEYQNTFLEVLLQNDQTEAQRRNIAPKSKAEFVKILNDWAKLNARRPVLYYPIGERLEDGALKLDSDLKFHLRAWRAEGATTPFPDIKDQALILQPAEFEAKAKTLDQVINVWKITKPALLNHIVPVQASGVSLDYIYRMLYGPDFGKNLSEWTQKREHHAILLEASENTIFATTKKNSYVKRSDINFDTISSLKVYLPKFSYGEKLPDNGLWLNINESLITSSYQLFSSGFGLNPKAGVDDQKETIETKIAPLFQSFQSLYFAQNKN